MNAANSSPPDAAEKNVGSQGRGRGSCKCLQYPVAHRMAHTIVDFLEAIEVEQHHRERLIIDLVMRQQFPCALEESAAVRYPAEGIDHGIDLVLQLGAFLRHVQKQKRHDDREQQRAESDERE
jgi:hypothetical protein